MEFGQVAANGGQVEASGLAERGPEAFPLLVVPDVHQGFCHVG